jgi:L-malate glycosyltransferase
MNILIYYPSNKRTISLETVIFSLQKDGHSVSLLTIVDKEGPLHETLREKGIEVESYVIKRRNLLQYYTAHILYVNKYIRKHKIDVVFSHIQYVNIIAVLAQCFTRIKFITFRHHDYPKNTKEKITDWIINKLSYKIVVPAQSIKKRMLEVEHVKEKKIILIPYVYDFRNYDYALDLKLVEHIRSQYKAKLVLVMVSRMVPEKRHMYALQVIGRMIKNNYDIKFLMLDEGTEKPVLQEFVKEQGLESNVFFLGFQKNVMSYIGAADALIHPSVAEASCSVVKEGGLLKKIVIACKGVGDFDDYVIDGKNGILLDQNDNGVQLEKILMDLYQHYSSFESLGPNLRNAVLEGFSLNDNIIKKYLTLVND